ncbi:hypothetical protein Hanom_Chr04g00316531 [Helianthus anomalus]
MKTFIVLSQVENIFSDTRVDSSTIRTIATAVAIFRTKLSKLQTHLLRFRVLAETLWRFSGTWTKPPRSVFPFDAVIRLKKAAESFGGVRYKIGYANQHSFDYVPPEIGEHILAR